jgi:DNA-binding MarR family transcriptional regulator
VTARLPLSALLSQVLAAHIRDLEQAGDGIPVPSYALWSNVVRLVGDDGVDQRELPRLARLSRRAAQVSLATAERQGWVAVEADGSRRGAKMVRLTPAGRRAREAWEPRFARVEGDWRERFGDDVIDGLRAALVALVAQLDLELPHHPTGYGPADVSVTGGLYVAPTATKPPVPPHGQDWPPVLRSHPEVEGEGMDDQVSDLPLRALLSQALVALAIEFETRRLGSLALGANVVRHLDETPRRLDDLPPLPGVTGTGKSSAERHGYLIVARDPADPRIKRVRLTARGQELRAGYEPTLASIEDRWCTAYGDDVVDGLRGSLESVTGRLDGDLPHYPPPNWN